VTVAVAGTMKRGIDVFACQTTHVAMNYTEHISSISAGGLRAASQPVLARCAFYIYSVMVICGHATIMGKENGSDDLCHFTPLFLSPWPFRSIFYELIAISHSKIILSLQLTKC